MFEVGFSELLLIMGLALLVLGPEKLPKVVSEIGRWMGRARAMARQFREQLEDEAAETSRRRQEPPPTPQTIRDDEPLPAEHASAASPASDWTPPATDQPAPDQPAPDQPAADQSAADQPVADPAAQDARPKE